MRVSEIGPSSPESLFKPGESPPRPERTPGRKLRFPNEALARLLEEYPELCGEELAEEKEFAPSLRLGLGSGPIQAWKFWKTKDPSCVYTVTAEGRVSRVILGKGTMEEYAVDP